MFLLIVMEGSPERIKRGSVFVSRVQAGKDFEDTLKLILKRAGWEIIPTDGRPTDVLAKLNDYVLMIEARNLEKTNLQIRDGKITQWKHKTPYPFRTKPFFKAKQRNRPDLSIIVTTATVNQREHEDVAIINGTPIKVMNYSHFRDFFIHSHTGRIVSGQIGASRNGDVANPRSEIPA